MDGCERAGWEPRVDQSLSAIVTASPTVFIQWTDHGSSSHLGARRLTNREVSPTTPSTHTLAAAQSCKSPNLVQRNVLILDKP